ncbi:hypothetical protein Bhyg_06942 [Pseudolycoriella hygida]|uniref:Uncharacterized protein n=1 Tax=Pseudolycoriella hygida TaxID=35572 RepID=A0A9Q0S1J0_9DIPT|nr:hypothetical protein Bhyg_06942 [Pseudolycoriella hygida]
MMITFPRPAKR